VSLSGIAGNTIIVDTEFILRSGPDHAETVNFKYYDSE
jgi:oligoribonuclease (3'-5' exoribonuclease)